MSAQPPAQKTAGLIEKEILKKRITNIEQGIMNVEVRYSFDLYYSEIVRAKRFHTSSFEISCSIFCGSLFHLIYNSESNI
ncbi:hypothetical protein D1AOALGA4SA_10294 [Olavius algarvensis Delta 1 endosymbiont]|nr:hypothetical protein D1AOALGA4SA_10294 [Olavius algarvensis Delta 1 endosymbiont]